MGARDALRARTCCIAATRSCRTARAAARRCRATRSRRATRTSRIRACTSRSTWCGRRTRRAAGAAARAAAAPHPRLDDDAVDARVERRRSPCNPELDVRRAAQDERGSERTHHPRRGARGRRARRRLTTTAGTSSRTLHGARARRACATGGRSTGCRIRPRASTRSSSARIRHRRRTARGVVHMAPAFGADDYAAGQRHGLAFLQPVNARGEFPADAAARRRQVREGRRPADHRGAEAARRAVEGGDARALVSALLALRHAAALLRARRRGSCARRRSRTRCSRATRASTGIRPRSAQGGSASGSRTTSTGRSRATATGARRCRSGCATRDPTSTSRRSAATPSSPSALGGRCRRTSIRTSRTSTSTRGRAPSVRGHDAPHARGHRHLVRLGVDAVRAVALSVREPRRSSRAQYPADFIAEGVDQTRGWFYSLLAIATGLGDALPNNADRQAGTRRPAPYRAVVVNDLVLDADGREDVQEPRQHRRSVGRDRSATAPMRCACSSSRRARCGCRGASTRAAIRETAGRFLLTLKNVYSGIFAQYANFGWAPSRAGSAAGGAPADRPLDAVASATVEREVDALLERYDATLAARAVMDVRRRGRLELVRAPQPRAASTTSTAPDNRAAFATLHEVLVVTCRLLAPFAPFVTDWMHRELTGRVRAPRALRARASGAVTRDRGARARDGAVRDARDARPRGAGGGRDQGAAAAVARWCASCPRARAPALRDAAAAARGGAQREAGRVRDLGRRARTLEAKAELPLAGQEVRQGDAARRGGGRGARRATRCARSSAGEPLAVTVDGETHAARAGGSRRSSGARRATCVVQEEAGISPRSTRRSRRSSGAKGWHGARQPGTADAKGRGLAVSDRIVAVRSRATRSRGAAREHHATGSPTKCWRRELAIGEPRISRAPSTRRRRSTSTGSRPASP